MSRNLNHYIFFQKKENIEGKKENVLTFECKECKNHSSNFYNKACLSCFLNGLYLNKDKKFQMVYLESLDLNLDNKIIKLFLGYFKILSKIRKRYKKFMFMRQSCKYSDFKCKIFPDSHSYFMVLDEDFYNPIRLYQIINKKLAETESKEILDGICLECVNSIQKELREINLLFKDTQIYNELENFQKNTRSFTDGFNFYEFLFTKSHSFNKDKNKKFDFEQLESKDERKELLDTYKFGDSELFQVYIYDIQEKEEKKYIINLNHDTLSDKDYFERIVNVVVKEVPILRYRNIIPLENLIELYKDEALRIIDLNYKISIQDNEKIAYFSALKILKLDKLFPLLVDDYIEEIFLDSPNTEIYINHQKYGRCLTGIYLSTSDIKRIITLLRLYSKQRLDFSNPTIKYVIKNKYFFCRFAVDIEPVNVNKFSLDIRKLNKNILTVQDLVKNNTLSPAMAAFIYFCILRRVNFTVTGETDTGKTTLINAFDFIAPSHFRKIYVENVIESLDQIPYHKHQLKYQADSLEDSLEKKYTKSNYIKTLLHRTPDIIFLGEILTEEEAKAMFHCLAAGLRGFQTIHSNTIDSLINRFIHTFKINFAQLDDLDLIILMKKEFNKRRIVAISELDITKFQVGEYNNEIFEYNPETEEWDQLKKLYETKTINKLKKFESLGFERFRNYLSLYNDIFMFLSRIDKISNILIIKLFHQISYYSRRSFTLVRNFWLEWKKEHENISEVIIKPN